MQSKLYMEVDPTLVMDDLNSFHEKPDYHENLDLISNLIKPSAETF